MPQAKQDSRGGATDGIRAPGWSSGDRPSRLTVQRKAPLDETKLNVVGEDHSVSGQRRAGERSFSAEYSGSSKYWTENEFRTREYSWVSDFFDDRRPRADPFIDRFQHGLLKAESTNPWHYSASQAPQSFVDYVQNNAAVLSNVLKNGVQRHSRDLTIMIGNLERDTDGFELTAQRKNEVLAVKPRVTSLSQNVEACIRMLDAAPVQVQTTVAELDKMWNSIKALKNAFGDGRDDAEVRVSRSEAMHLAAEARSGEAGVWKVGEKHVSDITGKTRSYSLVTEDAFNNEYDQWAAG